MRLRDILIMIVGVSLMGQAWIIAQRAHVALAVLPKPADPAQCVSFAPGDKFWIDDEELEVVEAAADRLVVRRPVKNAKAHAADTILHCAKTFPNQTRP